MDRRVSVVRELLNRDPWSRPDALASAVNLSASRLQRIFAQQVGCSIRDYSQHELLSRAAALLKTTFLSVKEVCGRVGYRDSSAFCRAFKQKFGASPKAYRAGSGAGRTTAEIAQARAAAAASEDVLVDTAGPSVRAADSAVRSATPAEARL